MTAETYLPPSIDPGQRESITGTIQFIIDKLVKQDMDNFIPAQVIAFNRTTNRVTVQIMITMINTLNQQVVRAQIASVPVLQLGGGGFVLSFPIKAGDFGWLKTTDVDISLFLNSLKLNGGSISAPNTFVRHKFDSSMFIPDTMFNGVSIASGDAGSAVLQSLDGTTKISISNGTINIVTPTQVNITSPIVDITASSAMTITCPSVTITGTLAVDGNVTGAGISLNSHVHGGVQTGSGDTGVPV